MNNEPTQVHTQTTRSAACLFVLGMLLAGLAALPGAHAAPATPDAHVASMVANPSTVNLGRTTTVTLTTASSYGAGADNYKITVYAPDGTTAGSGWANVTSGTSASVVLGDTKSGFKFSQTGGYTLEATHSGSFAASIPLAATNKLLIKTEFATASNPYTDMHNCPVAEEFQRGDEIIARGYVYYPSTGEFVNGTLVPTAAAPGKVTGTLFGLTQDIKYNKIGFWRAAWFIPWDAALGTYQFTVNADDGLGNKGTATSPGTGVLGALRVVPSTLRTTVSITDGTGAASTAFHAGDTMGIVSRVTYQLHFDHNYAYTNTNKTLAGTVTKPGPGQSYPLGTDRSGTVTATVGGGAFNATAGAFANQLANVQLSFDAASGTWKGTWVVPQGTAADDFAVRITAKDGAPTPNTGSANGNFTALAAATSGGVQGPAFYGLLGGALVVGVAGGIGVSKMGKSSGGKKGGKKGDDWE